MITITLTEYEALRVLRYLSSVVTRWPAESELETVAIKIDLALMAHEDDQAREAMG